MTRNAANPSPEEATDGTGPARSPSVVAADQKTHGTVLLALMANLVIAAAKVAGGVVTGSPALLAEAAHSVADSINEVFLLAALTRSQRVADAHHPFGYGKERFFWSMLAAVGIFVTGGCFSFYQGMNTLLYGGGHTSDPAIALTVLGVAFVAEGTSLLRAVHQVREESRAAGRGLLQQLRVGADPTLRTVFAEDSTAVLGVLIAASAIAVHELTGWPGWEGIAALLIAVLLAYIAYRLGRQARDLIIGEAADPELRLAAVDFLYQQAEIDVVLDLLTMRLGPTSTLLAARVHLADGLDSDGVEAVSGRIKAALSARFPPLDQVFLDITDATDDARADAEHRWRTLRTAIGDGGR